MTFLPAPKTVRVCVRVRVRVCVRGEALFFSAANWAHVVLQRFAYLSHSAKKFVCLFVCLFVCVLVLFVCLFVWVGWLELALPLF